MKLYARIALLAAPLGGLSAQVSVFEREFGQPVGDVLVLRGGHRPSALQDIQLLALEVVGRTRLNELLPGATRRNADIPGAARLILPNERGSLYHYRRAEPGGAATFGYFFVDGSGEARSVFELPGTGATGTVDPFLARLAVGPSGSVLLVATTVEAGGDLWEIYLSNANAVNRTSNLAPLAFKRGGLALLGTFGVGVADQGVFRFERGLSARASAVRIPRVVPAFGLDVVTSADQSTVAFLAGDTSNRLHVFTCRRTGDAVQASDTAMRIPGAGFLPDERSGPHLALSTDGSWVAWRRDSSSAEVYARETRPGTRPDLHVSADAHFEDTLNDTGVIAFFDPDSFVMVAGRDDDGDISKSDLFAVDLTTSGPTARNVSRTSGDLTPPFDYGDLETSEGLWRLPGAQLSFLAYDDNLGGRMLRFDSAGVREVVLGPVQSVDSLAVAGNHLVAEVTRPPGVDDPLLPSLNLVQFPTVGTGALVLALPIGRRLSREASLGSHDLFGAVLELETGGEWLGRLSVPTLSGSPLGTQPRNYGPTTALTHDGTLFASVLISSRQVILSWSDLGVRTHRYSPSGSFLLPGP
jgi:hypothetical protein